MSFQPQTVRKELADELQRLGDDRNAVPICLVLLAEDSVEFVWPAGLTERQIAAVEATIIDALAGGSRPYTRI